jgi:hypothetical protein
MCAFAVCRRRAWEGLPERRQARVDVHPRLSREEAELRRAQAALRGQSPSSLVAEALARVGLTGAGANEALVRVHHHAFRGGPSPAHSVARH